MTFVVVDFKSTTLKLKRANEQTHSQLLIRDSWTIEVNLRFELSKRNILKQRLVADSSQ